MEAIRKFVKVEGKTINITLPDDFYADEVEVIILPKNDDYSGTIPKWQMQQVMERSEAYEKNPSSAIDLNDAVRQIENDL
jgi:hypothetical protein